MLLERKKLAIKIKPSMIDALFVMNAKNQLEASSLFVGMTRDCATTVLIPNLQRYVDTEFSGYY